MYGRGRGRGVTTYFPNPKNLHPDMKYLILQKILQQLNSVSLCRFCNPQNSLHPRHEMALDANGRRLLVTSGSVRAPIYQVDSHYSIYHARVCSQILVTNWIVDPNHPIWSVVKHFVGLWCNSPWMDLEQYTSLPFVPYINYPALMKDFILYADRFELIWMGWELFLTVPL